MRNLKMEPEVQFNLSKITVKNFLNKEYKKTIIRDNSEYKTLLDYLNKCITLDELKQFLKDYINQKIHQE